MEQPEAPDNLKGDGLPYVCSVLFFFNGTAASDLYTLSLHDALPILIERRRSGDVKHVVAVDEALVLRDAFTATTRSEEHTSELQSRRDLVCRLLLEKKKAQQVW